MQNNTLEYETKVKIECNIIDSIKDQAEHFKDNFHI